jgi:acylphosphatase
MKAEKLRVEGRVQNVGYRRFVQEEAWAEGLAGQVKNERDGSVSVLIQGDQGKIERFVRSISSPPAPAEVRAVDRSRTRARPRLKYFDIVSRGLGEEIQDGFGAMQAEFRDYRQEFRGFHKGFKGFDGRTDQNFKLLSDKYGEISAKLTTVLETLQKESAETRAELKRSVDNLARLVDEYIARGRQQPP